MSDSMRHTIDRLEAARKARAASSAPSSAPVPAPAPAPGLRFPIGAPVVDLASGGKGIIDAGARDDATGVETYRIAMKDGRRVIRDVGEVAKDATPAAPAKR